MRKQEKFTIRSCHYSLYDNYDLISSDEADFQPEMTVQEMKSRALAIIDDALWGNDYFDNGKGLRRRPTAIDNDGEFITISFRFRNHWANAEVSFRIGGEE